MATIAAVRKVIERKGLFCSLYSDRGSHFFYTPEGRRARRQGTTHAVGRAPTAGVAIGRHHHSRRCQCIFARALCGRIQSEVHRRGGCRLPRSPE